MSGRADQILVLNQSIVQGKTDDGEIATLAETLSLLINRFGYTTLQTREAISSLMTSGKVRIYYKEICQRLSLKNPADLMPAEEAEKLVNETLHAMDEGLLPIPIRQAPKANTTICVSVRKPRPWKEMVVGETCKGFYEDASGIKVYIYVDITEPLVSDDYHRAKGAKRFWFVANPATVGKGDSTAYYLEPDDSPQGS